ncbi:MAG: response regulator, partial [Verrucomicrobiota bacterium]
MKDRWNVLVVDDSKFTHRLTGQFLDGTEFEIVGDAFDGVEGLNLYQQLRPDFVLLDIVMPERNGLATLIDIMAVDDQARVMMLSSMGTGDMIEKCLAEGATTFLQKPFEKNTLINHLRNLAGQRDSRMSGRS